jgi:hypothetical protein
MSFQTRGGARCGRHPRVIRLDRANGGNLAAAPPDGIGYQVFQPPSFVSAEARTDTVVTLYPDLGTGHLAGQLLKPVQRGWQTTQLKTREAV